MRVICPVEGNHRHMAGSHRVRRPRFGEPGWSAYGRGGGCDVDRVRRAAAAAVSATLSAAVVTIVVDGADAPVRPVRSPDVPPSAIDALMPVSIERPTGARPASARTQAAADPADVCQVASTAATVAPAPAPARRAPRTSMSIGRLAEPTALRQDTARLNTLRPDTARLNMARQDTLRPDSGRRSAAPKRRPGTASIGALRFSEYPSEGG